MASDNLKIIVELIDKASLQFKGVINSVRNFGSEVGSTSGKVNSSFDSMRGSLLAYAAGFATIGVGIAFLKSSVKETLEAEKAQSQLRRQIEASGVSWNTYGSVISRTIKKTSDYAIVQEQEVMQAMSRLVLVTNNVGGAMKNLNLVMDLAVAREMSLESAATLVGKAMEGDIAMLARFLPELKVLEKSLGENATQAQKAEAALTLLQQRVGGASTTMGENERLMKELSKAYHDFAETTGALVLPVLRDMAEGFRTMGEWAGWALGRLAGYNPDKLKEKTDALKQVEEQIAFVNKTIQQTKPPKDSPYYKKLTEELTHLTSKKERIVAMENKLNTSIGTTTKSTDKQTTAIGQQDVALIKQLETFAKREEIEKEIGLQTKLKQELPSEGAGVGLGPIMEGMSADIRKRVREGTVFEGITTEGTITPEGIIYPGFGEILQELMTQNITTPIQEMAEMTFSIMGTMAQGIGDAFANVIVYGASFSEAMKGILQSVAATIISTLIKIGVQQLLAWALGKLITTKKAVSQLATDAALTVSGVTANLAPTLGPAAVPAGVAAGAAMLGAAAAAGGAGAAMGAKMTPFAEGGIVTSPTIALIGEAGPEAVIPLRDKEEPLGGNITINFNGPLMGDATQARAFAMEIDKALYDLDIKGLSLSLA